MMGAELGTNRPGEGAERTRGMVVLINPTSSARTVARGVTRYVNGVKAHERTKSVANAAFFHETAVRNIPARKLYSVDREGS
jgi:hypothetical protein